MGNEGGSNGDTTGYNLAPNERFYKVAFSFTSGKDKVNRNFVRKVAEALRDIHKVPQELIFFDEWIDLNGRTQADLLLEDIYQNCSEFIVPFFSNDYLETYWTNGVEYEPIRIIKRKHPKALIPAKLEDININGFPKEANFFINCYEKKVTYKTVAKTIAGRIKEEPPRVLICEESICKGRKILWLQAKWELKDIDFLKIRNNFKKIDKELKIDEQIIRRLCNNCLNNSDDSTHYVDHYPKEISYEIIIDWLAGLDGEEGYKKLLCFIDLFLKEENKKIPKESLKEIDSWLDAAVERLENLDRNTLNPTPPSVEKEKVHKKEISYLTIQLVETDNANTYRVYLWLYNNNSYERITSFITEEIDLSEDSKQQFTEHLMEYLATLRINKEVNSIELEFIVPYELLWTDFEHWINKDGDPLGCEYPVIVKPEEALRNSKAQYLSRWKELNRNNSLNDQLIFLDKKTKPELKKNQAKLKTLAIKANKDEQCKGIVIESPLKTECESIRLFIRHGLPILLWARKGTKENLTEIFLRDKSDIENITISQLPNKIRNIRLNQGAKKTKNLEHNIILLIDDKERQLPKKPQLATPAI